MNELFENLSKLREAERAAALASALTPERIDRAMRRYEPITTEGESHTWQKRKKPVRSTK